MPEREVVLKCRQLFESCRSNVSGQVFPMVNDAHRPDRTGCYSARMFNATTSGRFVGNSMAHRLNRHFEAAIVHSLTKGFHGQQLFWKIRLQKQTIVRPDSVPFRYCTRRKHAQDRHGMLNSRWHLLELLHITLQR